MENRTFASILRELMRKSPITGERVTQRALADYLGVTAQSVYLYLNGRVYPECSQVMKIAGYFGVSVDYLLTGNQPENKAVRDTLKLSDKAIENLELCSEDFAPYIDMLLSDKNFFTTYQDSIQKVLDMKEFTKGSEHGVEFTDSEGKNISSNKMTEQNIMIQTLMIYIYFKDLLMRIAKE